MIVLALVSIFMAISLIFNGLGVVGLHRFPDVYTRLHAATKCTTFGSIFMAFTVITYSGAMFYWSNDAKYLNMALHTLGAVVALLITNPTGAHAIARAAHRMGVMPKYAVKDELKEAR